MKIFIRIVLVLLLIVGIAFVINYEKINRLMHTITLFDEDVIAENFQNMEDNFTTSPLKRSNDPLILPENKYYEPAGEFEYGEKIYNIPDYLEDTRTEGLLILKNDTIIYENYWEGLEIDEDHISWSMAKSFTSSLVGILHHQGLFELDDEITQYLPEFKGTGYDGVTIKNLLNMSSGVSFNEDYGDFNSDINRFGRTFAMGSPILEFAQSLKSGREQGTFNHYVSIDTQVLGFLLIRVSGRSLTELTQNYLWEPIGMEHDGSWIVDNQNVEFALGGLNASLRDYTKLGLCYKNKGCINGYQIVPEEWTIASMETDAEHLKAGKNDKSSSEHGYGLQWWIPANNTDAFSMAGIYNQYVYVDPVNNIIIAKLSANHKFKTEGAITKSMHFAMFEAMIDDILRS